MSPKIYGLTRLEKDILYRKYKGEGLSPEQASERIKERNNQLIEITQKMKQQGKTFEDIDKKFKQEFENICMEV